MVLSQLAALVHAIVWLVMGVSSAAAAPASTPWTFGKQAAQPQGATQAASSPSGKLCSSVSAFLWLGL